MERELPGALLRGQRPVELAGSSRSRDRIVRDSSDSDSPRRPLLATADARVIPSSTSDGTAQVVLRAAARPPTAEVALHAENRRHAGTIVDEDARVRRYRGLAGTLPKDPDEAAAAHRALCRCVPEILDEAVRTSLIRGLAEHLPPRLEHAASAHAELRALASAIADEEMRAVALDGLAKHLPPGRAAIAAHAELRLRTRDLRDGGCRTRTVAMLTATRPVSPSGTTSRKIFRLFDPRRCRDGG